MLNLSNVKFSDSGRVVSDNDNYDKALNPGIKTHNYLGKIFANIFGSGTVTVLIDNKKYYLNRGSCYHLLDLNHIDHTKKKQDFLPKIQTLFNKMHVDDLFQPNDGSPSENLSEHGLSNSKSKDNSIDSKASESSETLTSSDEIQTMRNTIATLTKALEDHENLPYETFAGDYFQYLVANGVEPEAAEETVENCGQSEYQVKIQELKNKISQIQIDLNNKLAATSSQPQHTNQPSSSSSIDQPPLKPTNPIINPDKSDMIKGWENEVELLTKQLEDLENLPYEEFAQQQIEKLVREGHTEEDAKEMVDLAGHLELETEISTVKNKLTAAQNTLNSLQR